MESNKPIKHYNVCGKCTIDFEEARKRLYNSNDAFWSDQNYEIKIVKDENFNQSCHCPIWKDELEGITKEDIDFLKNQVEEYKSLLEDKNKLIEDKNKLINEYQNACNELKTNYEELKVDYEKLNATAIRSNEQCSILQNEIDKIKKDYNDLIIYNQCKLNIDDMDNNTEFKNNIIDKLFKVIDKLIK